MICGKSPSAQPESFSYGNLGGKWGSTLKHAGYDALLVQGQADRPVYLYIHDGNVEIRDAQDLWGLSAFGTMDHLVAELGKAVSVLSIGPVANTTRLSAAGPIERTLTAFPSSATRRSIVPKADKLHRSWASLISTFPS